MNQSSHKQGFTIIELMLAMGFVSTLLLAIAMTIIQIGNTYVRGVTYKNVNQVGGEIASDLQRSIGQTKPFDIDDGQHYNNKDSMGGRLCTGTYSYIWNYGKAINDSDKNYAVYTGSDVGTSIYFIKIYDSGAKHCIPDEHGNYTTPINKSDAVELLDNKEYNLSMHKFYIPEENPTDGDQRLYSISFTLGTNEKDTLYNEEKCLTPDKAKSNPLFCATNQFNIVVRSGSEN